MISKLPSIVLRDAQVQVPCREKQLQQLAIYFNNYLPSPPILVAYGLEHTGKLQATTALLRASNLNHAVIKSRECLSQRHLITKIFASCVRQLGETDNIERYDRVDNLNSLVVNLQKLFQQHDEKFVLVIHEVDKQRGASHTLLPALANLGDMLPKLSVILTSSSPRSIPLNRSGVPYVHFPPYSRSECINMVARSPPSIPSETPDTTVDIPGPQLSVIYQSFISTVYDSLVAHTSSTSFRTFQRTCERLWPRFIWPMLSGQQPSQKDTYGRISIVRWDFARLVAHNRKLFHQEGERALLSRLTMDIDEAWTFEQLTEKHHRDKESITTTTEPKQEIPLLKTFSALLLISSYLASHTPPKHDIILFSRLSSSSTNKRRYLSSALSKSRTGGVRKSPTKKKPPTLDGRAGDETPSKKRKSADETGEGLAGERTPKSTRLLLEKTSNIPRPFTLERVIAILRTVHPEGLQRTKGAADKVYAEMAELERLRLVVRCAGDVGGRGGDDGILEAKWKINVGREFVVDVGKYWGIGLEGWEID